MKKENRKINCHSRGLLPGISTLIKQSGGDPRLQASGMTNGAAKGFTLIEILVVVVIIAVLATVAVSAYQRAVLKSRFNSLMPIAKTLAQGNEDYYLRNGQYTDDVNKLDIRATGNSKTQITLGNEDQHKYVLLTRDDMNNQLRMYQQKSKNFPGETHCEALIDDSLANWLCRDSLKGTLVGNKFGYTVYSLSPEVVGSLGRIIHDQRYGTLDPGDSCVADQSVYSQYGCFTLTMSGGTCRADSEYSCTKGTFTNGATCISNRIVGCGGKSSYTDSACIANAGQGSCGGTYENSTCTANHYSSCGGTFTKNSTCTANDPSACTGEFSNNSTCFGHKRNTCYSSSFDKSSCVGNGTDSCKDGTFTTGSICYANIKGACGGTTTYDATSYCDGKFCPEGARSGTAGKVWHREEGWGDETVSVLIDAPTTTE